MQVAWWLSIKYPRRKTFIKGIFSFQKFRQALPWLVGETAEASATEDG